MATAILHRPGPGQSAHGRGVESLDLHGEGVEERESGEIAAKLATLAIGTVVSPETERHHCTVRRPGGPTHHHAIGSPSRTADIGPILPGDTQLPSGQQVVRRTRECDSGPIGRPGRSSRLSHQSDGFRPIQGGQEDGTSRTKARPRSPPAVTVVTSLTLASPHTVCSLAVAQALGDAKPGATAVSAPVAASIVAAVDPAGSDHATAYWTPESASTTTVISVVDPTATIYAVGVTRTLVICGVGDREGTGQRHRPGRCTP